MQDVNLIRNVALFGHGKSGKTSLAEAMLFTAGKTKRLGKVDDGSSVLDFEPEEVNRHLSIAAAFHNYTWKKHTIFLTDTPGDDNFLNDTRYAAHVADCAIFTVEATLGVKYQTEKIAGYVKDADLPTILYINKMDRERADFEKTIQEITASLPFKPAVTHLPIGAESSFKGVVDLVRMQAFLFDNSGKVTEAAIPADLADLAATYRERLTEQVAEVDDELIEKFLDEGILSDEDLRNGLKAGAKSGRLCPVVVGAATGNLGTELLLDMINDLMPAPNERPARLGTVRKSGKVVERPAIPDAPFSALVFKTISDPYAGRLTLFRVFSGTLGAESFYNASKNTNEKINQIFLMEGKENKPVDQAVPGMIVAVAKLKVTTTGDTLCTEASPVLYEPLVPVAPVMSYAVFTAKKDDEDKLFSSISKILEEDPTLRLTRQEETKQTIVAGVGEIHLKVVGEKIKRKFGVEMSLALPKVPYKEKIRGQARVQGKHKKQTGGHGQFADSWLEVEPLPRGGGFQFEDKIVGGVIPRQYIPAVEKGVLEAISEGALSGFPIVDIKVALVDGSFHAVDSSEMAFKISGSMGFKKAVLEASPVLLEPIMNIAIHMPKDCVGDVMGDLNSRRGRVMGMDSEGRSEVINAQVPMAEILHYAPDLTSITGGRGSFTMEFSHYEELPANLIDKVIEAARQVKEQKG